MCQILTGNIVYWFLFFKYKDLEGSQNVEVVLCGLLLCLTTVAKNRTFIITMFLIFVFQSKYFLIVLHYKSKKCFWSSNTFLDGFHQLLKNKEPTKNSFRSLILLLIFSKTQIIFEKKKKYLWTFLLMLQDLHLV